MPAPNIILHFPLPLWRPAASLRYALWCARAEYAAEAHWETIILTFLNLCPSRWTQLNSLSLLRWRCSSRSGRSRMQRRFTDTTFLSVTLICIGLLMEFCHLLRTFQNIFLDMALYKMYGLQRTMPLESAAVLHLLQWKMSLVGKQSLRTSTKSLERGLMFGTKMIPHRQIWPANVLWVVLIPHGEMKH